MKWAWVGIHIACIVITLMELFDCWARARELKTPFGAKHVDKPESELVNKGSDNDLTESLLPSSVRQRKFSTAADTQITV